MPRISDETKERRKERLWLHVRQHNGISQKELAQLTDLENRTTNNYLRELADEAKIEKRGILWYALPFQEMQLRRFDLTAEEAFTLYLSTRLFVKQSDKKNEPAESALLRLAKMLNATIGVGYDIQQAAVELAQRKERTDYQSTFRTLVRAYLSRRKVKIWYTPLHGNPFETEFSIYLIEPSAIGFSTYIIGYSDLVHEMRSFKIERVDKAEMLFDEYTIPDDFPRLEVLRNAWSIVTGEETIAVTLRFHPNVAQRVLETEWHPSQTYEWDVARHGYLLWHIQVASTMDLLPWIRSWGADVEVLAPPYLRRQLQDEVMRLTQLYATETETAVTPQLHHTLYAKTDQDTGAIHLLLYHLLDVGQVAVCLWQTVLIDSVRQQFAQWLHLEIEEAGRFLAFLVALHDLGKASPAYQSKYAPEWLRTKLNEAGLVLIEQGNYLEQTRKAPHGTVSTWALPPYLEEICQLPPRFAAKIATAVGGHHGVWPSPRATDFIDDSRYPAWQQARDELVQELVAVFKPPTVTVQLRDEQLYTFLTLFSGFTSVADWLGSREDAFPFEERPLPTTYYARQAQFQAQQSLQKLGWQGWQPNGQQKTFTDMFAYLNIQKPRPVQAEVITAAEEIQTPSLLILEAPTGIGKTETAFYLADIWLQKQQGRGLYIAMPTQATSNQMFDRTVAFLQQRYPDDIVAINLAHGQWRMNDTLVDISLRTIGENENGRVAALSWFMQKSKRALLSPFAVGTVDQTLLSVLQTKHFFVRLFGLAHKVVIFDEIHAYDTYMSTLFIRLLSWLRAIGTSVILLSATLPASTRRRLVQAYTGEDVPLPTDHYPALTIATATQTPQIILLTAPKDQSLGLAWLEDRHPNTIVTHLQDALAEGGCAAIICNTVSRAQQLYQAIAEAGFDLLPDDLILFHARFPPIWRKELEDKVLTKFGKDVAKRPFRAIVIATQVIEQSLDLDFDVMITDLAPVDLVLQRAGRLHRHQRDAAQPRQHPRCLAITSPDLDENKQPNWGDDGLIYEPYILLRSYLALSQQGKSIALPSQTRALIEFVYTSDPLQGAEEKWHSLLRTTLTKMQREQHHASIKAGHALVRAADDPDLLYQTHLDLEEDNPAIHQSFQARTRDIAPGIDLICLHQTPQGLLLDPDDPTTKVELTQEPFGKLLKTILNYKMTIQHWPTLQHCLKPEQQDQRPTPWQNNAMLRHCMPLVFIAGQYQFVHDEKQYQLRLDRKLGLQWEVL